MFPLRLSLVIGWFATGASAIRAAALLTAFFVATAGFAAGDDDIGTAQSIISAQEQAFARDDAATAYGFAAPGIQSFYRSPDGFMFMSATATHRSIGTGASCSGKREVIDGKIMQEVQIVDADGNPWDALYTLETQADGSLKISACILKKAVTS